MKNCDECSADLSPADGGEFGRHDHGCSQGPWPHINMEDIETLGLVNDLVHEVAAQAASNAINSFDQLDFLAMYGYTAADVQEWLDDCKGLEVEL